MKLAAAFDVTLTVALLVGAAPVRSEELELARRPPTQFFDTRSVLALPRDADRAIGAFRAAASFDFAQETAPLAFAPRTTSPSFNVIDLGSLTRPEPRWKPKDALATGVPPRDKERHVGEAVARGMLGFVIGRAVAELAGDRRPGKALVKVRSASDPHGKGVGIGVAASW